MKLFLPSGLPASGKSTWAKDYISKNPNTVRVSRDDLRFMLGFGWKFDKVDEMVVKTTRDKLITDYLLFNKNVIVDELNLGTKNINHFKQFPFPDVEIEIVDFTHVDVNECIRRDAQREHPVGRKAIIQLWKRFLQPKLLENTRRLPTCAIFDLDGTLADFGDENPYRRDFYNDHVILPVGALLQSMIHRVDKVFIFSGRLDEFENETRSWLAAKMGLGLYLHNGFITLKMRKYNDRRPDEVIKEEFLDELLITHHPVFAVDDRKKVKRMWARRGIFTFDVNQHDLEF